MLYRGILGTGYSGSVGGLTASHCRGSQYFRQRIVPINPNTDRQQKTRISMTAVSEDWQELGSDYWEAWARFASSVRRVNVIGEASNRLAFNEYVRWAQPRYFANSVLASDLPMFPAVPTGPQAQIDFPIDVTFEDDGSTALFRVLTSPAWTADSDVALLIWIGANRGAPEPPSNTLMLPTHHYFRGPWYLAGMIRGGSDPEFAATLANPLLVNQKLPWKARLSTRYQGISGEVGGHAIAS